jgi:Trypsin-like peptidase domain
MSHLTRILFAIAMLAAATQVQARPQAASQPLDSAQIAKKISPAVVLIKGTASSGEILGTGFIISSDGKIATNLHVVESLKDGGVQLASGEKFDSFSILAFDARKDIAVIKIPGFDLPTVALGNSNDVQVGEPVLAVGSPLGLQGTVTTGVVSALRDDPTGGGFKVLQTDASVNPGNSGGPLVNRQAEVIGIVTFKLRGGENLNFAIPINYLRGIADSPSPAMSLDQLRVKLSSSTDVFHADAFPGRWKSLQSGTSKVLRRDGDRIYVETELPETQKSAGCFALSDLQKKGDIFSGTGRFSCVCQYTQGLGVYARTLTNRVTEEAPIEITSITSTRIEGREMVRPKGTKFDCKKAEFSKPLSEWQSFAWIPE